MLTDEGQWAPIVGTGLAAVGSLYLLLKSDGNSTVEGVCKHCAHHTNRSPSSRDSRSLRDSVDDSDRTRSPHVPVDRSATMSSSANDGMSPLRPSFTTLSRYLTGHASQATTVRSDVGGRRKVARMFHAVGKSFNSAAYEMMGTSGFEPTRAGDFPEIPGEANRNRKLKRIRERYNPPRDADGYETPLPRSRSRATSFVGSVVSARDDESPRRASPQPAGGTPARSVSRPRAITLPTGGSTVGLDSGDSASSAGGPSRGRQRMRRETLQVPVQVHHPTRAHQLRRSFSPQP